MYYPNAHRGVKKLFIAQIVVIVAGLLAIIPAVLNALPESIKGNKIVALILGINAAVFALITLALLIVAFVLELIGLLQGGKDSDYIRLGFWITIGVIILSVVSTILRATLHNFAWVDLVGSFVDAFADIASTAVMVCVIFGVSQLAASLNNEKLVNRGRILLALIITIFVISIIASILSRVFGLWQSPILVGLAIGLAVVAGVLEVFVSIIYFFFLFLAVRVLRK